MTLDDKSARMDVRLFPDLLETYEDLLQTDRILMVSGQVSFDEFSGGNTMTVREVMDINQAREKFARALVLSIDASWCNNTNLNTLESTIEPFNQGTCPLEFNYFHPDAEAKLTVSPQWYVTPDDELIYALKQLLIDQRVTLEFH